MPNYATQRFGIEDNDGSSSSGLVSNRYPYLKYTWKGSIVYDIIGGCNPVTADDMTFKTIELPRWTTETQIVNAYNHKTIVQTKLNYEPITISFYDQQNDAVDAFIWSFVKNQFDPCDASKAPKHNPFDMFIYMHAQSGGPLRLSKTSNSSTKLYVLKNCYIVDATHDTLDYSQSDVVLWTITVRYECLNESCNFAGDTPKADPAGIAPSTPTPTPKSNPTPDDSVVERKAPIDSTPNSNPKPDAEQEKKFYEFPAVDTLGNPLGYMERREIPNPVESPVPKGISPSTGSNGRNNMGYVDRSRANRNLQNRSTPNNAPMNPGYL